MNFRDENDLQENAGEYVLGVLTTEERRAFNAELQRNRKLAAAVGQWQDRLLRVAPPPEPIEPPATLWPRIEGNLAAGRAAARKPAVGLWSNVQFWRAWGIAGALAVLVLAVAMLLPASIELAPGRFVAVLEAPGIGARWIVQADSTSVQLIPVASVAPGAHQALQFWTKQQGAAGPTSLGLVAANQRVVIPASRLPGLGANQLFEVTLEPENGSPLPRPTGPVLALGRTVRL